MIRSYLIFTDVFFIQCCHLWLNYWVNFAHFEEKAKSYRSNGCCKRRNAFRFFSMLGNSWIVPEWTAVPHFAVQVWRRERFQKILLLRPKLSVTIPKFVRTLRLPFGNELMWQSPLYFVFIADSVWRSTGLGPCWLACALSRAMISALICMQMTPKSMGSVVRLQRLSFRTSSLPASMM